MIEPIVDFGYDATFIVSATLKRVDAYTTDTNGSSNLVGTIFNSDEDISKKELEYVFKVSYVSGAHYIELIKSPSKAEYDCVVGALSDIDQEIDCGKLNAAKMMKEHADEICLLGENNDNLYFVSTMLPCDGGMQIKKFFYETLPFSTEEAYKLYEETKEV